MDDVLTIAEERLLMERCRLGDEAAWARLYQLYGWPMARFLRRVGGAGADVEDLVQQVFVECFRGIGRFRSDARVAPWLYGVASNVAAKARRSAFRRHRRRDALADEQRAEGLPRAGDPGARVEARERLRALEAALETLGPKHRTVWVLAEVEGLSGAEIAGALGVREPTVRTRLSKARRRVLEALQDAEARERARASTRGSTRDAAARTSQGGTRP